MVDPVPTLVIGCLFLTVLVAGAGLGALVMRAAMRRDSGHGPEDTGCDTGSEEGGSASAMSSERPLPLDLTLRCLPNGGILVFDHDLHVRLSEGNALPCLGLLRGRSQATLWQGFPEEAAQRLESAVRRSLAGETISMEMKIDGRDVLVTCGPLHDSADGTAGAIVVLQIVDALKQLQRTLLSGRSAAERRAKELEIANRSLSSFAGTTANDLREPLRSVSSHLSLLRRRTKEALDPQSRAHLLLAEDGVRRAERLVLDVLDYARLGESLPRERVALAEALALALRDLRQTIDETGATVDILDPLPTVLGAPGQLHRLFLNLLVTMVKHRSLGAVPVVHVACSAVDGLWHVKLMDKTPRLNAPKRDQLFEPFQSASAAGKGKRSTVGVTIARRIVELHGGRMWVEGNGAAISSGTFEGCTFIFTLPVAGEAEKPLSLTPAQRAGLRS